MEKIYNKLVRDNIPNIIKEKGATPVTKVLDDETYKQELEKKLYEECKEVVEAEGEERLEELADVLEVVSALANFNNSSLGEIIKIAENKKSKRGSFDEKIFLEKVVEPK